MNVFLLSDPYPLSAPHRSNFAYTHIESHSASDPSERTHRHILIPHACAKQKHSKTDSRCVRCHCDDCGAKRIFISFHQSSDTFMRARRAPVYANARARVRACTCVYVCVCPRFMTVDKLGRGRVERAHFMPMRTRHARASASHSNTSAAERLCGPRPWRQRPGSACEPVTMSLSHCIAPHRTASPIERVAERRN